jgi:hypothetical protein
MNPTQGVTILGTQAVSQTTVVSIGAIAASMTIGTIVTVLGTQVVSVVPGLSVQAVVSGTVSVSGLSVTAGVPAAGATGIVMWIAGGQSSTAFPVVITGTVTAGAGTTVVSLTGSALVSGTVSVLNIAPVTTQASVSVTGLPVWMNPTQGVTILGTQLVSVVAGTTVVSGTVSVNTLVTILSTVNVAIVAGAGGGGSVTTTAPGITATGQVMWVAGGQSTTVSPVFVSQINPPAGGGGSVTVAPPNISATGQIMWIVGGQSTTAFPVVVTGTVTAGAGTTVVSLTGSALVSGTVSLLSIVPVTTQASVSVSGIPVWFNPGAVVSVTSVLLQPVLIIVSSTVVATDVTLLMTVFTGNTFATSGASFWVVPAGKVFRVMNMMVVAKSSAVINIPVRLQVHVGTAAASLSVTSTVGIAAALPYMITAANSQYNLNGLVADIAAGTSVGLGVFRGTTHTINGAVISGYLF